MCPEVTTHDTDWHRSQAVAANNSIWELLTKATRTAQEDEELLRRAYTAAYHWQRTDSAGPENEARAAYMIAKSLLATGQPSRALITAQHCLEVCLEHGLVDFDLAYAHEVLTRALLALDRITEAGEAWANAQAVAVAEAEDRQLIEADFADLLQDPRIN